MAGLALAMLLAAHPLHKHPRPPRPLSHVASHNWGVDHRWVGPVAGHVAPGPMGRQRV